MPPHDRHERGMLHWEHVAAQPSGQIALVPTSTDAAPPRRGLVASIRRAQRHRAMRRRRRRFSRALAERHGILLCSGPDVQGWIAAHWHRGAPIDAGREDVGATTGALAIGRFPALVDVDGPGGRAGRRNRVCLAAWISEHPTWTRPAKEFIARLAGLGFSVSIHHGGLVAEARAEDTDSDPRDASLERLFEAVRFVGGLAIALGAVPWSPGPNAPI